MNITTVKNGFMLEQDDSIHVFETPQSLADFVLKWAEEQDIEMPALNVDGISVGPVSGMDIHSNTALNDGCRDWEGGDRPVSSSQWVEY